MFVEKMTFNGVLLLWCELAELFSVNRSVQERLGCQDVIFVYEGLWDATHALLLCAHVNVSHI